MSSDERRESRSASQSRANTSFLQFRNQSESVEVKCSEDWPVFGGLLFLKGANGGRFGKKHGFRSVPVWYHKISKWRGRSKKKRGFRSGFRQVPGPHPLQAFSPEMAKFFIAALIAGAPETALVRSSPFPPPLPLKF